MAGPNGRSPAEIGGSNPTVGMVVCSFGVLCVVRWRPLGRADHSSRGVLYQLWCVIVSDLENLMNDEAMVRWGPSSPKQIMINEDIYHTYLYCECEDH